LFVPFAPPLPAKKFVISPNEIIDLLSCSFSDDECLTVAFLTASLGGANINFFFSSTPQASSESDELIVAAAAAWLLIKLLE
jgi:hypothetical protein